MRSEKDDVIGGGEGPPRGEDGRVLLAVPFSQKDEVKSIGGARWDPQAKIWYVPASRNAEPFKKWWSLPPLLRLDGEDREFGGNHLFVDPIPSSCWLTNVRYCVSEADWFRLRKFVYGRAQMRCEICEDPAGGLEAHERWDYDQNTKIQRLRRLICLCSACHEATHMGLAQVRGNGARAEAHIARVNGWSSQDVSHHVEAAFEVWEARNRVEWALDIGVLENAGINAIRPVRTKDRIAVARTAYDGGMSEFGGDWNDATDLSEDEHF